MALVGLMALLGCLPPPAEGGTPLAAWPSLAADQDWVWVQYRHQVRVGEEMVAVIRTRPGALCLVSFRLPDGTWQTADGLVPKQADAQGLCAWRWRVEGSPPGRAWLTVAVGNTSRRVGIEIRAQADSAP